jgi:hypothetical protein
MATSQASGPRTFSSNSACAYTSAALPAIVAPAASKSESEMFAPAPAPDWTVTEWNVAAASFLTVSGVAATRVSPGRISVGIPILIDTTIQYATQATKTISHKEHEAHSL